VAFRSCRTRRRRRRLYIGVDDVEPQSKKMDEADKDDFQRKIFRQLKHGKRAAVLRSRVSLRILNMRT
jgi:hypothetical protein